jgi:hypothetical protein
MELTESDAKCGRGVEGVEMLGIGLMVDVNGVLNAVSLDVASGKGWEGPDTIGAANLIPGSPVSIFRQSSSVVTALMVDVNGVLNAVSLDVASGKGWEGPETIGTASLVPGSSVAIR